MIQPVPLEKDIATFYVTAASFPQGIMEAFDKLKAKLPPSPGRSFWGFSRPEKSVIQYRAAVEEAFPGEAHQLGLEQFVVKTGTYLTARVSDWMQHPAQIGAVFQEMLQHSDLDPDGWCLEEYEADGPVVLRVKLR